MSTAPAGISPALEKICTEISRNAVVQVMTYLVENETAALNVPSRFIVELHPHFREVMQVLAVQAADEARHIGGGAFGAPHARFHVTG